MRNGTTLCLLLTLLVACGEGPATKPPTKEVPGPEPKPTPMSVVLEVEATLPGTSAVDMEEQAALPLERALSELEGVERTTTTCTKGQCVVRLRLGTEVDVTEVRDRVQTTLLGLEELSGDAKVLLRPLRTKASYIALLLKPRGDAPLLLRTLRRVAETIVAPQLKQERGVSEVVIRGGQRPRCVVVANPSRLAAFDVTPLELAEAVTSQSPQPGSAAPPTMDEIQETVVAMRGEEPVRLADLAEVRLEMTKPEPSAGLNVSILVTVEPGSSAAALRTKIAKLALELPEGVLLKAVKSTGPTTLVWISNPEQQEVLRLTDGVRALVLDVSGVKSATVHRADNESEVVLELKRERLAPLGVTDAQVAATVQLALGGRTAGMVLHDKESVELVVRLEQERPRGLNRLKNLRIRSQTGAILPLSSVASLRHVRGPGTVFRLGSSRAAVVRIQMAKDANTEKVVEAVRLALGGLHGEIYVESHELGGT